MSAGVLTRKFSTALRMYRNQGAMAVVRKACLTAFEDRWIFGRIVELAGNKGRLEGLVFELSHPLIATPLKSRFLLRSYETEARRLIARYLPADLPVVELGGSIGVVSCFTNRRLKRPEAHVVVEAAVDLVPLLKGNRDRNGCRFEVLHAAIAYGVETVTFYPSDRFNEGSVFGGGTPGTAVPASTLASILELRGFAAASLICDIEGSELDLIAAEGETLRDRIRWIIMETHGFEKAAKARTGLEGLGFTLVGEFGNNQAYRAEEGRRPAS